MIWQDAILTAGSVFFCLALIPTLRDRTASIPRFTSVTTALWLVAFAATQVTLGLRLAPVCEVVCAGCWAFIALRRGSFSARFNPEKYKIVRFIEGGVELENQ